MKSTRTTSSKAPRNSSKFGSEPAPDWKARRNATSESFAGQCYSEIEIICHCETLRGIESSHTESLSCKREAPQILVPSPNFPPRGKTVRLISSAVKNIGEISANPQGNIFRACDLTARRQKSVSRLG